jgi:hypothetical protein
VEDLNSIVVPGFDGRYVVMWPPGAPMLGVVYDFGEEVPASGYPPRVRLYYPTGNSVRWYVHKIIDRFANRTKDQGGPSQGLKIPTEVPDWLR